MTARNQQTVELLKKQQAHIIRMVVDRQYAAEPEVWNRYGQEGYQKSLRDVDYHLSYFYEALLAEDPSLFVDYLLWVKELFIGLNLPAPLSSSIPGPQPRRWLPPMRRVTRSCRWSFR